MDPTFKGLSTPTPTKNRPGSSINWRRGLIIGLGLIGFFVILGVVATLMTPSTTNISQRLLYRMDALTTLTTKARPNIKGGDLDKINTDLSLMLVGDNAALKKAIPAAPTTPELSAMKKEEEDSESTAKLKTALVNGAYDATYRTILTQKLEATAALLKELYGKTSSASVKQTLTATMNHLSTYYQQLKKLP